MWKVYAANQNSLSLKNLRAIKNKKIIVINKVKQKFKPINISILIILYK